MINSNRWKGIVKCYPYEEKRLLTYKSPYLVQIKYDGDRGIAKPFHNMRLDKNFYLLFSSEENIISCLPHLNSALDELNCDFTLDGELYNHQLHKDGGHELIHGICSSQRLGMHNRFTEVEFHIFDIQSLIHSQVERLSMLMKLAEVIPTNSPLKIAPFWLCENVEDVKKIYDYVISEGYEGIIIRNFYAPYEINKRSRYLMKFKPKKKDTYKIIGWKEEISKDGIPKSRIGSLILSSQTGDNFSVSSGLNDEERNALWKIKDELPGKEAIVHYQHLTNKKIPKGTFDIEVIYDN